MNTHKFFNFVLAFVFAFSLLGMPAPVSAQDTTPTIQVNIDDYWVQTSNWPSGAFLAMTISASDVTYSAQSTVGYFDLPQTLNLQPGDVITITDGITTKTYTIAPVQVTNIDVGADTIAGTATPGSQVDVHTNTGGCCTGRLVTTDEAGNWFADFHNLIFVDPNHPGTVDLIPGSGGQAVEIDDEGNQTWVDWNAPNPSIEANITNQWIVTQEYVFPPIQLEWPLGTALTLTIDNPSIGTGIDYTGTTIVDQSFDGWGRSITTQANFAWPDIGLQPGYIVTVTGNGTSKTLIISSLQAETIDVQVDTIAGIASPDATIQVCANIPNNCIARYVMADSSGYWLANYHNPGIQPDEQETVDIQAGTNGWGAERDVDGDRTWIDWRVLPSIDARFHENEILGYGWPLDSTITMTIDDPSTGVGVDYSDTQTAIVSESDPTQTIVQFRLWENNFELENGQIVTMSDGVTNKTHVVAVPTITAVNPLTDIVQGLAAPSTEIWVDLLDATRRETADANGHWSANFRVPGDEDWETQTADIWSQTDEGEAHFQDEDGDSTTTNWGFPYLLLSLRDDGSTYNWIESWRWPARSLIYLAVDDPSTPQNPDYTDVQRSERSNGKAEFDYVNFHDHPGFSITLSNGYMAKTIIIPIFSVTGYDITEDTINGTSNPFTVVTVRRDCINEDCSERVERRVVADNEGKWLANFAVSNGPDEVIYDIQPGDEFTPHIDDGDWDTTKIHWSVPSNQPPTANASPDIDAYIGDIITLDASASSDPEAGPLTYEWDLDNDGQYDDASGVTITTSFNEVGDHIVGLRVTDDSGLSDTDSTTVTILPWTLKGFYPPVDMNNVYNIVKGGSTVPLKFEIFAGSTELTDIAYIKSLTYAQTSCDASATTDEVETTATGGTSLRYDVAAGQFIYNWKTPKAAGKCYRVTMTTVDGSTLMAYFKLK